MAIVIEDERRQKALVEIGAVADNKYRDKMKERMRAKNETKPKEQPFSTNTNTNQNSGISDEELVKIFSTGEKVEKTPRGAKPPTTNNSSGKKKKSKK